MQVSSLTNVPVIRERRSPTPDSSSSLMTKILGVAGILLLTFGSSGVAAAPLIRRHNEIAVISPNFPTLQPLAQQFGPFVSPELRCYLDRVDLDENLCSPQLFSTHEMSSTSNTDLYYEASSQPIPPAMQPYCEATKGLTPLRDHSTSRFPENFSAFLFNGIGFTNKGDAGCLLETDPTHYQTCSKSIEKILSVVKEQFSKKQVEEEILTEAAYRYKGFQLGLNIDGSLKTINVGINPQNHYNYQLTLKNVEENFLSDPCFFQRSPEHIIEFIKDTHQTLLNNVPSDNAAAEATIIPAGTYRNIEMLVYQYEGQHDFAVFKEKFLERGGKKSQMNSFITACNKLASQKPLSDRERKILSPVIYVAPLPEKVEELMQDFAIKLKAYAEQEIHPVALAAWAHCEIGRIHPFKDGNGRLARLLTNAILVRGGYEPVIFFKDEAYSLAVNQDGISPGAFASYLAELIKQQNDENAPQLLIRV